MRRSRILGIGGYVPDRVVTNQDLTRWMETSDAWIQERTGIQERRWVPEGQGIGSSDLALEAAKKALERADLPKERIQMVVFATLSPDHDFPGTGVFLQRKLGLGPMPVIDLRQQCTGFLYGLAVADQFIRTGMVDYALVCGAEVHSTGLDISTRGRDVSVLFGDGGGAAVLGPCEDDRHGILATKLYADGTYAEQLWTPLFSSKQHPRITHENLERGDHYPKMDGRQVFKHAVHKMPEVVHETVRDGGHEVADLDLLVPHQANLRINQFVQKSLGLPDEKVVNNIQRYGNTTAATIPLCLQDALLDGRLAADKLVCLVAFGSGFTWAGMLVRW